MTKQHINTGQTPNDKSGDLLRTAFTKVNANFDELYAAIGTGGGSSVTTSATTPVGPTLGALWYDTVSGRTYVYYDSSWVDASPVGSEGISSTSYTPTTATDWNGTAPTTIQEAIDRLAAVVKILNSSTGA